MNQNIQENTQAVGIEDDAHNILQLVTFCLGEEEFGVNILIVSEIIRLVQITVVPHAPPFIEGVINLRGRVLPVIGLRKRFGMPAMEVTAKTRIVVMMWDHQLVGFLVDSVSEVLRLPVSSIEETPPVLNGVGSEYIEGVGQMGEKLLVLLNMQSLMENSALPEE